MHRVYMQKSRTHTRIRIYDFVIRGKKKNILSALSLVGLSQRKNAAYDVTYACECALMSLYVVTLRMFVTSKHTTYIHFNAHMISVLMCVCVCVPVLLKYAYTSKHDDSDSSISFSLKKKVNEIQTNAHAHTQRNATQVTSQGLLRVYDMDYQIQQMFFHFKSIATKKYVLLVKFGLFLIIDKSNYAANACHRWPHLGLDHRF